MNTKQEVIEWLINNDELIKDIIRETNKVIDGVEIEFKDEARDQQIDAISRTLAIEFNKNTGLTSETLYDTLDKETLKKLLENL